MVGSVEEAEERRTEENISISEKEGESGEAKMC